MGKLEEAMGGGGAAATGDGVSTGTGVGRAAVREPAPTTGQAEEDKPTENDALIGVDIDRDKAGTERGGKDEEVAEDKAEDEDDDDGDADEGEDEGTGKVDDEEEGEHEVEEGDVDVGTPPTSKETGACCRSSHWRSNSECNASRNINHAATKL